MILSNYILGNITVKKRDYAIYIVLALCFFLLIIPLLHAGICCGDDRLYHLARIQSLADSLKAHQFPIKIHATMANDYGYGTGFFYADFFLYIPAILIAFFGTDLTLAYKLFMFLFVLIFLFVTYFSARFIIKDKYIALIPTVIIGISHYVFLTFYLRFALGEMLGFLFLILVITGMYDVLFEDYKHSWLLLLGACGAVLSHLLTTVFLIIFCVLMVLCNPKQFFVTEKIKKIICDIIVIILLTAFYWIPMVEQMLAQSLEYLLPWTSAESNTYAWKKLFGNDKYTLGINIVVIAVICIVLQVILKKINKLALQYLVIGIVITILTGCKVFWKIADNIFDIQFPWRLFGMVTVLIAFSFGLLLKDFFSHKKWRGKGIAICLLLLFLPGMYLANHQIYKSIETNQNKTMDLYSIDVLREFGTLGGGHEYLPINTTLGDLVHPLQAEDTEGNFIAGEKTNLVFIFKALANKTYQVPFVFYKGYHAKIIEGNKTETPLKVSLGNKGFVSVHAPKKGTIVVWYQSTFLTKIAYVISGITFLLLLCGSAIIKIKERHTKEKNKK